MDTSAKVTGVLFARETGADTSDSSHTPFQEHSVPPSLHRSPEQSTSSRVKTEPTASIEVMEDRDLLRRMVAGDEQALGRFYDRWAPLVHSVAAQVVPDPNDAEEVVEETFWQVWRQADRYEGSRGAVSTWLIMIARSRALDRLRRSKNSREDPWEAAADGDAAELHASGRDPLQNAESAERSDMVRAALHALPREQREAMELAYMAGLSQTEIAFRTGQPLGTVKTRARLALRKLRDTLSLLA